MPFSVCIRPSAAELWGNIHLDAHGMDGARVDIHASRAEAETCAGRHTRDQTASVRVARFVEAPFWFLAAYPPEVSPGLGCDHVSEPVLVVVERGDGSRRQQVATWRVDPDEPESGRWVSDCSDAWTLEGVTRWRQLDWPA